MADERAIAAVLAELADEWDVKAEAHVGRGAEVMDTDRWEAGLQIGAGGARKESANDLRAAIAAIPGDDAARALTEARDEIRRMLDGFPERGRHTRARWALLWLDHIIDRRAAHAAAEPEAGR